nr:MAG TPA: hypothetical protein [Caudoviricetes sp.]
MSNQNLMKKSLLFYLRLSDDNKASSRGDLARFAANYGAVSRRILLGLGRVHLLPAF